MTIFEKFVKCLEECEVDFQRITKDEIVISMPGYVNNGKVFDYRPIAETSAACKDGNEDLYETFFFGVHVLDDGELGISWSVVQGEDAE